MTEKLRRMISEMDWLEVGVQSLILGLLARFVVVVVTIHSIKVHLGATSAIFIARRNIRRLPISQRAFLFANTSLVSFSYFGNCRVTTRIDCYYCTFFDIVLSFLIFSQFLIIAGTKSFLLVDRPNDVRIPMMVGSLVGTSLALSSGN
jgi:hypothetical protein